MQGTSIEFEITGPVYGAALIAEDDSVWLAVRPRWWDLATWLWWWLSPSDRKASVKLAVGDGIGGSTVIRTRAVRISKKFVRIKGLSKIQGV